MKIVIFLIGMMGILAAGVYAQQTYAPEMLAELSFGCQPPRPDESRGTVLDLFDSDRDDRISVDERNRMAAVLERLDVDQDGFVSMSELPERERPPRPRRGRRGAGPNRGGPDHRDSDQRPSHESRDSRSRPPLEIDLLESTDAQKGTVIFHGGHETDRRDGGRPVALIAASLGVAPQVFRDAFKDVQPSRTGPPTAARARANKTVLMNALGPHGVTNDRLDEVSDYYRYKPGAGEIWRRRPARAEAIVKQGKVTGFKIVDAGNGYISAPRVEVAGFTDVQVQAKIAFGDDFETNGRIVELTVL